MWGLFRRRKCFVPTWRGALALLAVFLVVGVVFVRAIHPFLAPNDPVMDGVLVLEGWAADYELAAGVAQFRSNHYDRIFVTGGPLEWGAPLSEYRTYAERGAAVLLKWGLTTNEVQAVPAPDVRQDRTYAAALTLGKWFREHHLAPTHVQLMSVGPHARRSRLLYQKALGPRVHVGVIAVPDKDYDPKRWWRYSAGVRGVIDETVAYIYAKFFFHPSPE
ncbi:MAG: YdcF family protein [Limisphaerales bacterium]